MMKGVNDQPEHARALVKLMREFDAQVQCKDAAKVNLIPFNPFPGTRFERSDEADIRAFQKICSTSQDDRRTVRRTRGDDIDAACGQLQGPGDGSHAAPVRFQAQARTTGNQRCGLTPCATSASLRYSCFAAGCASTGPLVVARRRMPPRPRTRR